jgi:hypothetical protein
MHRDLFWALVTIAPVVLAVIVALLAVPRYRRMAATALLACVVGATAFTALFHFTYALPTWRGHASAIEYLNGLAVMAGFAASAIACACGYASFAGLRWICGGSRA